MRPEAFAGEQAPSPPARASWWRGMLRALCRFYGEHARSAFFSVALALILDKLGLLKVFTKLSLTLVASLASQGGGTHVPVQPGAPTVVVISQADFQERYGEKSPMDHCLVADDLRKVLDKGPRVLGVDIDLSPLVHPSPTERECQLRLDRLIDQEARRLVLLVPFATHAESLQAVKHRWMQERCSAGVAFADGTLDTSMGLVTDYAEGEAPLLATRLAEQLHQGRSDEICRTIGPAADHRANRWLSPELKPDTASDAETTPIDFPSVLRRLPVVAITDPAFGRVASLAGSAVLFGVDSTDDVFLTPIGQRSGVVIHGSKLVSFEEPVRPRPRVGAWFDTVIALCFAWVVHGFWRRYVEARREDHRAGARRRSGLSTLWMAGFVFLFIALAFYFVLAGEFLFTHGIAVAPLLIALSMLVDGFVAGPVDQIDRMVHHEHEEEHAWLRGAAKAGLAGLVLALVLLAVVGSLAGMFPLSTVAGWAFVFVVILYAAASITMLVCGGALTAFAWSRAELRAAGATASVFLGRRTPLLHRAGAAAALLRALVFWLVIAGGVLILVRS